MSARAKLLFRCFSSLGWAAFFAGMRRRGARPAWALLVFAQACAAVSAPQGGPRDTTPPRLVATSPDSAARNVRQRFVRLTFSEPVQTKELSKNLLVTPQLRPDNPYKLREDRNSISLYFDKPLDENTTYSFNFRQGIVDVTESLPAKYAALSFSTGAVLDSGAVRGTVTDLLTAKPAADVPVGLYPEGDTAGVRRGRPYYLTRTDAQGNYQLGFVKAGRYRLYAWADKNNNGRFDDGEKIAYLPDFVRVTGPAAASTALALVRPDRRPPLRTGLESSPTQLKLRYNEGLQAVTLSPVGGAGPAPGAKTPAAPDSPQEAMQIAEQGRAVLLYRTPALADGRYLLAATDSAGNTARDTLTVRFPVPATTAARKAAPAPLYSVEGNPKAVYRQGQVKFRFAVPVRVAADRPFGQLVEDSVKRRPLRLPADGALSADRSLLTLKLDTKAQKSVIIQLDSGAVVAVTGQSLRLKPLRLALSEQSPNGAIFGTIQAPTKQFFLQLLDEKFGVVAELRSPRGTYRFDQLTPGPYRLRVLLDLNGDGRWQSGDPNLQTPAEPVYVHPKPLQVRANWEIEENVKVTE